GADNGEHAVADAGADDVGGEGARDGTAVVVGDRQRGGEDAAGGVLVTGGRGACPEQFAHRPCRTRPVAPVHRDRMGVAGADVGKGRREGDRRPLGRRGRERLCAGGGGGEGRRDVGDLNVCLVR